ncbi:hypothetical protein ACFLZ7_01170 [Nanoarchaeota archaeon]
MTKKRKGSVRGKTTGQKRHKKEGLPPGIKVLITYASVVSLFYLIYLFVGIQKPISIFFGNLITGAGAMLIDVISVVLLGLIIFGLAKKKYWVFWLSLGWFAYGVINAIVSAFMIQTQFLILKNMMLLSAVSVLLLNGLIVWYIYSEKEFFKTKHLNKVTRAKDHMFVYIIASVLIISILLTLTIGVNFYKTTVKTANSIIEEFTLVGASEFVCDQKIGEERDICYVVLAVTLNETDGEMCESVESDFYKLTCYRAIS